MALTRSLSQLQPWSVFLVRLVVGVSMTFHGFEKLIPPGGLHRAHPLAGFDYFAHFVASLGLYPWLAYVSILTELLGGLLLLLGLLTRFAAFMVAGNLIVALVTMNLHHGYTGSEYTLALIAMAILLVTAGSGAFSLDRRFGLA